MSALHLSALEEHKECISILIQNNANQYIKNNDSKVSVNHMFNRYLKVLCCVSTQSFLSLTIKIPAEMVTSKRILSLFDTVVNRRASGRTTHFFLSLPSLLIHFIIQCRFAYYVETTIAWFLQSQGFFYLELLLL